MFRLFSDLHLEFDNWRPSSPRNLDDVLILAGDIAELKSKQLYDFLSWATDEHDYVLYVPGNHEYYQGVYPDSWDNFASLGVTTMNNSRVVINGQGYVASTLWSKPKNPLEIFYLELGMNDFRYISTRQGKFSVHKMMEEHDKAVAYIRDNTQPGDIVITHHAPSFVSIDRKFYGSKVNSGFATELSDIILDIKPKYWLHGHTHTSSDYRVGTTRVLSNPRGYGPENAKFIKDGYVLS